MPRPTFHDIVPPEKRSIKNIPIPERRTTSGEAPVASSSSESYARPERTERPQPPVRMRETRESYDERPSRPRRKKKRVGMKVFSGIVALALIGGVSYMAMPNFSGAVVDVTPRSQSVSVDSQFAAVKEGQGLQYQTVTIAKDGKLVVPGTEDEFVETKASGIIIVYNKFNSSPQKLVASTRFETPEGLIFRLNSDVTVPGAKVEGGKTVPGSVEASVTADKVGAGYNVALTDFTIPGFKGDARYEAFYARSKIAMQGGFSGTRKKVADAELKSARDRVRNELQASLIRQAEQDIPSGYFLPENAFFIEYESLTDTPDKGGVQIAERAVYHGIMFKKTDLAKEIAKKVGATILESDIQNTQSLSFVMKNGTSTAGSIKPWDSPSLAFALKGTTTLVSLVDTEKLKSELAGKPRKNLSAVLASYPGVEKAEVIIRPFWKSVFPENKDEIVVEIQSTP